MQRFIGLILGVHAVTSQVSAQPAPFAQSIVSYDSGVGFATDFYTGEGYTLPETSLGAPGINTAFGPVTPFNPPFERSQLVSLGVGGSLVWQLGLPALDDPAHRFGIDFIIYGSTGFIDVDYPNGLTDETAAFFGNNPGETRVSVSADNLTFYTLDPALAPVVDGLFPTDGQGIPGVAVDPALTADDLANQSLESIRSLYRNSAGGTGFDLAWAVDDAGQAVVLESVSYVRVDVLSGRSEIDAIAVVVPEPGVMLLWGLAILASLAGVHRKRLLR